ICGGVTERHLAAGEVLFNEGEPGDAAYVVISGEVEVVKAGERRETLLAVRGPGVVMGEMALLRDQPRNATVRARTDLDLFVVPRSVLDDLLDTSPSAARAMFSTLLDRWEETNQQVRFNERLAQLGTLTAGVAHELNNPAAAIKRSAERLDDTLAEYREALAAADMDSATVRMLGDLISDKPPSLSPLARSDLEAEVAGVLEGSGVGDAWRRAPALVEAGMTADDLAAVRARVGEEHLAGALRVIAAIVTVRRLVSEIRAGAGRLSSIVGALKSYSYLDLAPVQEVDVRQGLDETVLLLGHRLRDAGAEVVTDYQEDLPRITAFGTELNQVWTNLIDNAADAVAGIPDARITIRAKAVEDDVVVEVEDNGHGIPEEIQSKVFDSFFTTKPPGQGTGLGLQITHRIVVFDHGGAIDLQSEAGRTVFTVRLPIETRGETEEK
ncbi:MAG: GHKL domain-containing protein, partial [Actinobacteria bacterium]